MSGMPEWVSIWAFMRLKLGDFRALPMQETGEEVISQAEYEQIRARWASAGSPQYDHDGLANAMRAEQKER